ncbi:hypothetical protein GCM10010299_57850 [Streptomyces tanashiensis]|nr:hypothetical protein GCM10010299_57850 [Streptomyces tanashiensis]
MRRACMGVTVPEPRREGTAARSESTVTSEPPAVRGRSGAAVFATRTHALRTTSRSGGWRNPRWAGLFKINNLTPGA